MDAMRDVAQTAHMVPMLPCGDIDEIAEFWTALGLSVTYRQLRPNPYVALRRHGIDLHYYGMPDVRPELSHSTCAIVVADTAPLHTLFADGLRARYGRVPLTGVPRMTRPRPRANNAGLSGFSVVDPAGNWIRVSGQPDDAHRPRAVDARTEWVSAGGGPLARAVEHAVVTADSHGDVAQAHRALAGAVRRHADATAADRAAAWAYLAELRVRLGDLDGAREAARTVTDLAQAPGLPPQERAAVAAAAEEVAALPLA